MTNPLPTIESIAPIELEDRQRETHEVVETWADEAHTVVNCRFVVRKTDRKGDGRVLWFHPSGGLKTSGQMQDGVAVGLWYEFLYNGVLESVQEPQADGGWIVTIYGDGKRSRQGVRRKDAAGYFRDDGWWEQWDANGRHTQQRYDMGNYIARRPHLPALKKLLDAGSVKQALEDVSQGGCDMLFSGIDGLIDEGYSLSLEAALGVAKLAWEALIPRAVGWVASHGRAALPTLEQDALALMAEQTPDSLALRRTAVLLHACGGPLESRFYPLLDEAMATVYPGAISNPLIDLLRAALREVPLPERETLVMGDRCIRTWSHGHILWLFAGMAPTHRVVSEGLKGVEVMKKGEFTYNTDRRVSVQQALDAFALALPQYLTGFLEAAGKKCPQRELVVRALANANNAALAETLLVMADDSIEDVRRAARDGLHALGDKAVPALEAARLSKKSKIKALAEELLAEHNAKGEPGAALPAPVAALEAVRAGISADERERLLGLSDADRSVEIKAIQSAPAERALTTLAVFIPGAREGATTYNGVFDFNQYLWQLTQRAKTHPAAAAMLAEVLVALKPKGPWPAAHTVTGALDALSEPLLQSLAWHFETRAPDAAEEIVRALIDKDPTAARAVLAAAACDTRKGVREAAVQGLVKAGPAALPDVTALLARKDDGALSAAEVLRHAPAAAAVPALEAALAAEKGKKRKEAFEEALAACKPSAAVVEASAQGEVAGQAPAVDYAKLDAELSARAAKRKKKLPALTIPGMQWVDGTDVSEGAAKWFFAALTEAEAGDPNTELWSVRKALRDDGCAALQKAIENAFPWNGEHRWKVYAAPFIADDIQLKNMAVLFQTWASTGMHVLAGHGIEALRRHGQGVSIAWVDHWADEATGKLGRSAREALEKLCADRGLDRDLLVDAATPKATVDPVGIGEAILRRLELAMLTGRTFSDDGVKGFLLGNPLVREAGRGLLLRGADGTLARWADDATLGLDAKPVTLTAPVSIPHPCDIDDDALDAWGKALAAAKVVQPFKQLERSFSRDPESDLKAFVGKKIKFRPMVNKLGAAGYHQSSPEDAGIVYSWYRNLGAGWQLVASHEGYAVAGVQGVGTSETGVEIGPSRRDDSGGMVTRALRCEALADLRKIL